MCGWMEICFVTLVKYCDDHFAFLFSWKKALCSDRNGGSKVN